MLCLGRKLGEKIYVSLPGERGELVITVVDLDRGRVRLGIDAPADVRIEREELRLERLTREAVAQSQKGEG